MNPATVTQWRWQWQRGRYSGWQLGTDGVQSDDKFDMLASDRYVDIEQAVFLLECLIQEKDDSLKDKAILGLFISFVLPTNPGQGRCGGVPSPVYCHAFSFTRGCSIIIVYNNYDVARLCSPRNGLARVSFRVTSVIFSITVLGSIICYLFFLYKNELTYIVKQ